MRKVLILKFVLPLVAMFSVFNAYAQQEHRIYNTPINYLIYYPQDYNADKSAEWPLVIFLHGVGEVGMDVNVLKGHGLTRMVEQGHQFPFILVSPQAKTRGWDPKEIRELLEGLKADERNRIDEDRVYLTGLSMGGFGTWYTAQRYPELFAAILPICGGGNYWEAWRLKNMPIWNFHGDKDQSVSIEYSDKTVEAVRAHNPNIKYTVYEGVDHYCWDMTYENPEIYDWLLSHKRFKAEEVELDGALLDEYAGVYKDRNDEEITVEHDGNTLKIPVGDGRIVYVPYSETEFFTDQQDRLEYLTVKQEGGNTIIKRSGYMSQQSYVKVD